MAAVMGSVNKVFDFDLATKKVTQAWSGEGLQAAIAVDGTGEHFAITSGLQATSVDIYARQPAGFQRLARLDPPGTLGDLQAYALSFDRLDSESPFLAVAWGDSDGTQLVLTAYSVSKGGVNTTWSHHATCPNGTGFNFVMQPGLAVTAGGEMIAVGDWGCQATQEQQGKLLVFRGRGGDGATPLLEATLLGQVWAVDVDADPKAKMAYVSAGSWASKVPMEPAQVSTWSIPLPD